MKQPGDQIIENNHLFSEEKSRISGNDTSRIMEELEHSVFTALKTYSNVHRGSGHFSQITTHLFDKAREIMHEISGLPKSRYQVLFASGITAHSIVSGLKDKDYRKYSSLEYGLAIGVNVLIIRKKVLRAIKPAFTGGGTARLMSPNWVVWSALPGRFEAGTPAIINIITFVKALLLVRRYGEDIFKNHTLNNEKITVGSIYEENKQSPDEAFIKFRHSLMDTHMLVPTLQGNKEFVYLDNAASTPALLDAWYAFRDHLISTPGSQKTLIRDVREKSALFLNAPTDDYDIWFTANTTESINLVAQGMDKAQDNEISPVILGSIMEHSSNELPWRMHKGLEYLRFPCNDKGFADHEELSRLLRAYNVKNEYGNKRIVLVTLTAASNVLGNYVDLSEISHIVHKYNAKLLVDAAQMVAHRKIDMSKWNIDFLAFSAHKMYAPFGTGVLIMKKNLLPVTKENSEFMPNAAEENIAGIAAFGKVLDAYLAMGWEPVYKEEEKLTRMLIKEISKIPEIDLYGAIDPDSEEFENKGGVIAFSFKKIMADRLAKDLARSGAIGLRYGCHCAHIFVKKILKIGPGLERFQRLIVSLFPALQLPGITRVSMSLVNNQEDINRFVYELEAIVSSQYKKSESQHKGKEISKRKEGYKKEMSELLSKIESNVYN